MPYRKNPWLPYSITTCKKRAPTALIVCVPSISETWSSHLSTASVPYTARPIASHVPSINPRTCCSVVDLSYLLRSNLWRVCPVRRRIGMPPRLLSRSTSSRMGSHYLCWSLALLLVKVSIPISLKANSIANLAHSGCRDQQDGPFRAEGERCSFQ